MTLEGALTRIIEAGKYLHAETCRTPHQPYPCVGCPRPLSVARALDLLEVSPRDARGVRRIFHDADCVSGCGPDSDHADRTQATTAAALRRFRQAAA